MTQISIANIGNYPRIGEDKDQQRYRRGFGHFERKDISAHAFRDVEQSVAQEIIREQLLCNLDEVTDGLIGWQDPISHFCKNVVGIETAGLARYLNTNFYYRVPVIVSKPRMKEPILAKEFQFAQSVSNKPIRAVITGPLTLAAHVASDIKSFEKISDRIKFFTALVKKEIKSLLGAGARTIQIDEPFLPLLPTALPWVRKSLEEIIPEETSAKFILALYFSPLANLWDALQTLPVQGFNLDFTSDGAKLYRAVLEKPGTKEIGFGLIDARSTKMETVEAVAQMLRRWMERNPNRDCTLTPSAGLELLPRNTAFEKLSLLLKVRNILMPSARPETVHG